MLFRASKTSAKFLNRSYTTGKNQCHTYLQTPGQGVNRNVTLIPGQFIGPEVTCKIKIF